MPYAERERVQNDPVLGQQYSRYPLACTTYVGFTDPKPPMDNVCWCGGRCRLPSTARA